MKPTQPQSKRITRGSFIKLFGTKLYRIGTKLFLLAGAAGFLAIHAFYAWLGMAYDIIERDEEPKEIE